MRRRAFLSLVGAACLLPTSARAQQSLPVIGFLNPVSSDTYSFLADAFGRGLAKAGFVDGRNVRIEYRWGDGDYGRLGPMASDLASRGVSVIAATGDIASARAAQAATRNIPTVFTIGGNPVTHGLVASLNRPGGNITGVYLFSSIMSAKRLQLLFEFAPQIRRVGLFMNPDNFTAEAEQKEAIEFTAATGREAIPVNARNPSELEAALGLAGRLGIDSYLTASDPLILDRRGRIIAFGQQNRLPGIGFVRQFSVGGTLLSYGPSIVWMYEQCGEYVGAILKGAKVAELPVVQPTDFDFAINLRTATALGLTAPPSLLTQATEIID
jgi:putative ABC transport system substrate-binding protein